MFSLIEHIEYLMMHHDCVVVPGWGALIAQYSPSFYDSSSHVIERPRREVSFNAAVDHNDGLLAQSLMRRHRLSYNEALNFIADSVTGFRQQLATGNEVSFGRLGYFHRNDDGNAQFMPFFHETYNDEFFGLRSVQFAPLSEMTNEDTTTDKATIIPLNDRNRFVRHIVRAAASIALLVGLFFLLSTPIVIDDARQFAGLNMPSLIQKQTIVQPKVKEQPETTAQEQAKATTNMADEGRYFLVVSTLSSERQVNAFIKAHPSMAKLMKVQKRGKIYRVYVKRSDDREALTVVRKQLPAEFADAWVTAD